MALDDSHAAYILYDLQNASKSCINLFKFDIWRVCLGKLQRLCTENGVLGNVLTDTRPRNHIRERARNEGAPTVAVHESRVTSVQKDSRSKMGHAIVRSNLMLRSNLLPCRRTEARYAATERVVSTLFGAEFLRWHLRGLESTVSVIAEARERAIWKRSAEERRTRVVRESASLPDEVSRAGAALMEEGLRDADVR